MAKKPRKDCETEDDSLEYLQGIAIGTYSSVMWSDTDRIDPKLEKKEKTKQRIGFVDTTEKKKKP